ncbi:serine hydrolase [Flavobacterium frigoris]|uniref:CubicO group peptidase, beta-lactamase class C family n=1 Tax=Flavobacterium frigoris TaxID=229204 RepID=A0A1H9RGK6_FLAFI|nr:serine hydrolase [Flavobacterium frigoris]SER71099.1 CubicO group peptidase, beta-lactamase class C family [Flavobacterium frigoris]
MKKTIRYSLVKVLFLSVLIQLTTTSIVAQNKAAELDKLMNRAHATGVFNGTVLVAENGKVIYRKAFGYANKELKQQLTPDFCFDLASVSKQFTGMGIMVLKERKQLSYDDKITTFFPEFPSYGKDITVRDLLNNISGMPKYESFATEYNLSNTEILKIIEERKSLDSNIGERYVYNNAGYVMLALIIEKVSGMSLADFLKENVFRPLKMKNTLVGDTPKINLKNRAIGYTVIGELDDYQVSHTGSTSIFSNVDDLFLWDQALYTDKLVSKRTIAEAFTPIVLNDGSVSNYGFGWFLTPEKESVNHSGSDFGYRNFIFRDLAKKNTYIWLTNAGNAVLKDEINVAIENILASKPYKTPKITVFSELQKALQTNSVNDAIAIASKSIKANPNQFVMDDAAINELGYKYLNENKLADVFSIFKFNLELNPNSSNVYDSLGEIYLLQKDTVNAIENYKKSVALNPNNANAVGALKKLGVATTELIIEVKVAPVVLKTYIGRYQLNENYSFTVTEENGILHIQGTGERLTTVIPMSENRFYSKIVTVQFTFNKDEKGIVDSLTLNMGKDMVAKKVE